MDLKHRINQVKYYVKRYGFLETVKKCFKRIFGINTNNTYANQDLYKLWIENNEPKISEINEMSKAKFDIEPLISIVVPMYNTDEKCFEELVDCMISQIYQKWELCLADR